MKNASMVDIALQILKDSGNELAFNQLFNKVCEVKELSEEEALEKISVFYTNITMDGRFITLGENVWDLRERHKFESVHIDMKDIYAEYTDDEEESDNNEVEEDEEDEDDGFSQEDSYDDED